MIANYRLDRWVSVFKLIIIRQLQLQGKAIWVIL